MDERNDRWTIRVQMHLLQGAEPFCTCYFPAIGGWKSMTVMWNKCTMWVTWSTEMRASHSNASRNPCNRQAGVAEEEESYRETKLAVKTKRRPWKVIINLWSAKWFPLDLLNLDEVQSDISIDANVLRPQLLEISPGRHGISCRCLHFQTDTSLPSENNWPIDRFGHVLHWQNTLVTEKSPKL
jgi:hypothetical protein